jgi:DNA-binding NtrC family response regulator
MESPTVLVIGDGHHRRMLAGLLPNEGFRVLTARTVDEGMELYRREVVNVLMMDIRVGVRTLPSFIQLDPNVKCCFMSAGDDVEVQGLAVVTRPFCLPTIAQALWGLVTHPDVIVDESC